MSRICFFVLREHVLIGSEDVQAPSLKHRVEFVVCKQLFVHLLPASLAYDGDLDLFRFFAEERRKMGDGLFDEVTEAHGWHFQHKDLLSLALGCDIEKELNRLWDRHEEAGHVGVGNRDRLVPPDLLLDEREDAPAAPQHVAKTDAREFGLFIAPVKVCREEELFRHELRDAEHAFGLRRLIGGNTDDMRNTRGAGNFDDILGPDDIGLYRFERIVFAQGDVLERRGVEHDIDSFHGERQSLFVADISDDKADRFGMFRPLQHELVVTILVAREYADSFRLHTQELPHYFRADGTGTSRDQYDLAFEYIFHTIRLATCTGTHFKTYHGIII